MVSKTLVGVLGLHFGVLGVLLELGNLVGAAGTAGTPLGVSAFPMAIMAWVGGLALILVASMDGAGRVA